MLCFKKNRRIKRPRTHAAVLKRNDSKASSGMGASTEGLSIQYVTKRIIALTAPSTSSENVYRESLGRVVQQLKTDHYEKYKIWNVSRNRMDLTRCGPLVDMGWPGPLAPPLDRLCMMCKQWEQWLTDPSHVVVVHSKGDPARAALAVCAFMHYNAICANDDSVDDRFSMQRYADRYLGAHGEPSHKRYLTYFSNLLSGKTRVNPAAIYLQKIVINKMAGREVFFKIYEKMKPVHTTPVSTTKESTKFDVDQEVKLRGDILIKCIENRDDARVTIFLCQFNTCALELIGKTPTLKFYKEELDLIFSDSTIDNQCQLELVLSLDPPKIFRKKSTSSDISRTNSYEYFGQPEDAFSGDPSLYSQIQKGAATYVSEDSGVSIESPSSKEEGMGPPPVPPKPRPGSSLAEESPQGEYIERRGVLPASVRSIAQANAQADQDETQKEVQKLDDLVLEDGPEIPSSKGTATPSIEPDLVGKDRYDKASKCFSYVPAKSLKEAYSQPKKPPPKRQAENTAQETIENIRPEDLSRAGELTRSVTDLIRRPESPKWTDTIESAPRDPGSLSALDHIGTSTSDLYRIPEKPTWEQEIEQARKAALRDADPYGTGSSRNGAGRSQSAVGERIRYDDDYERPTVYDASNRSREKPPTSNGTLGKTNNYGTYRDDPRYRSEMDDLCDPDFYLNYNDSPRQLAPKSEQLPRKEYRPVEPISEADDFSRNERATPSRFDNQAGDRDAWRERNCRSVTAAPTRDRKLIVADQDATSKETTAPPDDWLTNKLRKLKSKRDMDPDLVRRRTQEKMLLEELKNTSAHETARHVKGKEFSSEGNGVRDPLEAYRREEERLKNTYSPFDDMPRRHARGVRGKPPTPPPRERSRSPPQSRVHTPSVEQLRSEQGHYLNGYGATHSTPKETNIDDDFGEFAHLNNIVKNSNASTTLVPASHQPPATVGRESRSLLKRSSFDQTDTIPRQTSDWQRGRETPSQYQDRYSEFGTLSRAQTPSGQYFSGQERVAAAIARAETPNRQFYGTQERSASVAGRSETPHFPTRGETPLPYHPLLYNQTSASRPDLSRSSEREHYSQTMNHRSASPRSNYYGQSLSRRSSLNSVDPGEIIHHHPVFVKDVSKYWYKPAITREQAINMLRDKAPGTFVVRDSNSFPGAFGLALKVAAPPPGVQPGDGTELVRHFLIEPSPKGVKLKGCNNEPVFGSLSALVYQHSITPLALPAKLLLPDFDPASSVEHVSAAQLLLDQGAACNVAYIGSVDCESLTGPACVKRCVTQLCNDLGIGYLNPVSVHFKVSGQGVTLTDNTRKLFFRRHFPTNSVIYAGGDPDDRRWDNTTVTGYTEGCVRSARLFAVVARKVNTIENQCHVFAELEPEQPAHAVLNFINKVLLSPNRRN